MNIKPLILGNKVASIPVIQGGMGIGISLGNLAGAVAAEGAVGMISSAQIGFREEDYDRNSKEANLRAIKKEYDKARALAPDGIIGFNIMVAVRDYEEQVKAAILAGADLIVSGAGLPMKLPEIANDSEVLLGVIVSSEKSAKVILKYWDTHYHKVPDLVVIEGPEAGGHLGFSVEQLNSYTEDEMLGRQNYEKEVSAILKIIQEYEKKYRKIPVALAGGIDTSEKVEKAFSLGVDAVQVASRFVTTWECDADIRYKEAYLHAKKEDIVLVKSPVGMPGRAIRNGLIKKVEVQGRVEHKSCHQCLAKCRPAEIPYCITEALIHAAKGEVEDALLFCGAQSYKAEKIETVKEVLASLTESR